MGTAAITMNRAARLWDDPVGKKAVMAVTGVVLFLFVIGHMIGNLQIYSPPDENGVYKIDEYGKFLHHNVGLLWGVRSAMLACVFLHILTAVQLTLLKWRARPVSYYKKDNSHSSYSSRTMIWTGPMLGAFVIYHLLHFTSGQAHPDFVYLSVRHNVITGFQQAPASLFYMLAMILLGFHLYHGVWSMFQSMGVSHPLYTPILKGFAKIAAVVLVVGNCSIPLAVMTGFLR